MSILTKSIITFIIALQTIICNAQSENSFYYQTDWGIEHYTYNLECDNNQMELYARNDKSNIECIAKVPFDKILHVSLQKKNILFQLEAPFDYSEECFGNLDSKGKVGVRIHPLSCGLSLSVPFYSKKDAKRVYKYCIEELIKRELILKK